MALDTFAPQYFSQGYEPAELFEFPYILFATDRSPMVPPGGNKCTWPDVEGSVTTQTYSKGTNLTDGEGRDVQITLDVDQEDAVAIPLDDLDRVQRQPQVMAEYMLQADRELRWAINDNIRSAFRQSSRLAASGLTEPMRGSYNGLTSNKKVLSLNRSGSTTSNAVTIDSKAGRQQLVAAFDEDAGTFAKRHGWVSPDAATKGVAICPIEVGNQIRRYLTDDVPNLGAGSFVDSAFGLGQVMKVGGWEIVEDATQGAVSLTTAAAQALKIDFMHPQRRGAYYARQLAVMETERIQLQFGTRLKSLYLHGAIQGAARHMYEVAITLVT